MGVIRTETLNVIQLGIGFFFIFFAFNSQGFIEQPVIDSVAKRGNIDQHAGYYSLSIIYAVFTVSNFFAAPVVDILSAKWSMIAGALLYTAFQIGFLKLNQTYLYISSAALGVGASVIWTGQGNYLAMNCDESTNRRNSSMLWGMSNSCLLAGGVFLFIVFHSSKTTDDISDSTVKLLYATFSALSIVGIIVLALLRTPPRKALEVKEKTKYGPLFASTFKLFFTPKMFLIGIVSAFLGVEQSFWTGIYPTCISFTKKLGDNTNAMLALATICEGLGQMAAGGVFGILSQRTNKLGRDMIVFLGCVVHLIVFALVYINFPPDSPIKHTDDTGGLIEPQLWLALISAFLLTFADGCWNTQMYSLLVSTYPDHSAQAFALYKFYQSGLSCAAFYYGSVLQLQWQLLILVITALLGAVAFFTVERMNSKHQGIITPIKDEAPTQMETEVVTKGKTDIETHPSNDSATAWS